MYIVNAAKLIGAGLATIGLVGAGVGIGVIFGAFLMAYSSWFGSQEEFSFLFNILVLLGISLTGEEE